MMDVPTAGIIIQRSAWNVPIMKPDRINAPNGMYWVLPPSSRYLRIFVLVLFNKLAGVPKCHILKTLSKFVLTVKINNAEKFKHDIFSNNRNQIQIAAIRTGALSRSGDLSALLMYRKYASAMAIIMVPMMIVHTICDESEIRCPQSACTKLH